MSNVSDKSLQCSTCDVACRSYRGCTLRCGPTCRAARHSLAIDAIRRGVNLGDVHGCSATPPQHHTPVLWAVRDRAATGGERRAQGATGGGFRAEACVIVLTVGAPRRWAYSRRSCAGWIVPTRRRPSVRRNRTPSPSANESVSTTPGVCSREVHLQSQHASGPVFAIDATGRLRGLLRDAWVAGRLIVDERLERRG